MQDSTISDLASHFDRHLVTVLKEIAAYPDDASMWRLQPGILNSGGTLVLHIAGNLEHFLGSKLGEGDYVRDRAGEFADRDVPRDELVRRIESARDTIRQVLADLSSDSLATPFPGPPEVFAGASTARFLSHLTIHLGYHLGQLNYHRRLLAP